MRVIFHIGAGKTGSSSIQKSLKANEKQLKENGIWYLGMMLDLASTQKFDWQKQTSGISVEEFHKLSEEDASKQILDILRPTIEDAKKMNYHTLVWSNESFFGRKYNFTKALKSLQDEGVDVEILVYVRDHASWSQSAYIQWGIKHKTYKGKLQSFSEWIKNRIPYFYKDIHRLDKKIPNVVNVHNMSACQNVVLDFYRFLGVEEKNFTILRDNDSPNNTELFLHAAFNSKFQTKVLIRRYDHAFGNKISYNKTPEMFLKELLADKDDLLEVDKLTSQDRKQINNLLKQQDEKPLQEQTASVKSTKIDTDELVMALSDMLMEQAKRISILEQKLRKIELTNIK